MLHIQVIATPHEDLIKALQNLRIWEEVRKMINDILGIPIESILISLGRTVAGIPPAVVIRTTSFSLRTNLTEDFLRRYERAIRQILMKAFPRLEESRILVVTEDYLTGRRYGIREPQSARV